MHPFFLVPELVDQLLAELHPTSLPVLACTARLFYEPVLRLLYGRIVHPKQLFALIGGAEGEASQEGWTAPRLAQFDLKAQHVLQVDFAPHGMPLSRQLTFCAAWSSLLRSRPSPLPNLRSLALAFWNPESSEFVLSLIGPKLQEITVLFTQTRPLHLREREDDGAERCGAFFRTIERQGCQLRSLRLWGLPVEKEEYELALAQMLENQAELTQVSVAGEFLGFCQALPVLAQCPVLHDLEIIKPSLSWDAPTAFDSLPTTSALFPALQGLRITAPAESVTRLLSAVDGRLDRVDMEMTPELDVPVLAHVAQLAAAFSDTLQEFRLIGPYSPTGAHLPLPWSVFHPLLDCHALTSLSICLHWWGDLAIQDEDIGLLARALPHLQCLRIWTTVYPEEGMQRYLHQPAGFTLSCLGALASCKEIRLISLTGVDATGTHFLLPSSPACVHHPVRLGLRAAPLTSPQSVAFYLQTLFLRAVLLPRYAPEDAGYAENTLYAQPWDLVDALMRYHRAARAVERGEDAGEGEEDGVGEGWGGRRIVDLPPIV
ncbi:hypothetical protein DACRYDRAFT_15579 [Dacryopinax primogenitus]|uniref:F-box domain-containing protein n=1 Tax=Dacryopinax primogenitus (strain DJM 731) TaxID=1858805 RepID=M5G1X9_DACPD|nr:uncharacterized protein DACRYDRAFT_15579 [Dacryopinax primogenitus]EJU02225.1 hypothetical protein DACRYDRAFT_15579 [Dacryopinax primogenitus]